jgi:hypothetical protein
LGDGGGEGVGGGLGHGRDMGPLCRPFFLPEAERTSWRSGPSIEYRDRDCRHGWQDDQRCDPAPPVLASPANSQHREHEESTEMHGEGDIALHAKRLNVPGAANGTAKPLPPETSVEASCISVLRMRRRIPPGLSCPASQWRSVRPSDRHGQEPASARPPRHGQASTCDRRSTPAGRCSSAPAPRRWRWRDRGHAPPPSPPVRPPAPRRRQTGAGARLR